MIFACNLQSDSCLVQAIGGFLEMVLPDQSHKIYFEQTLSCIDMNFSKQIFYNGWVLQASFEKIHAPVDKFFVILKTKEAEEISFDMVKHFDHWVVIHPAPDWVISFQDQLSLIINNFILN